MESPQVNLKWSAVMPDVRNANSDALRNYAKAVTEKTQGRVAIEVYWDSALGRVNNTLQMLQSGIADGAYIVTAYYQWELPLTAAAGLPFLTTGYRIAPQAFKALYNEWEPLQEELSKAGIKPLYFSQSHEHYLGINRPINSLDDLQGLRIWGGGFWPNMLEQFGACNVSLTTPEVFEALEKGAIDGFVTTFVQIKANRFYEYARYLVTWPFGGAPVNPTVISLNAWDNIAPADREIMDDEAEKVPGLIADQTDAEFNDAIAFLKERGVSLHHLSRTEIARGIEKGKPAVYDKWFATCKEKHIPGEEFLKRYTAIIEQLS